MAKAKAKETVAVEPRVRLRGLKLDRVARIKGAALEFAEDSGIVEISGANEQGKSSLIESIWVGLGGTKLQRPIHGDAKKGSAEVYLDVDREGTVSKIRAVRSWKMGDDGEVKEKLEVFGDEDRKLASPQAVLDSLLTTIAWDPFRWLDLARSGLPGRRKMVAELLEGLRVGTPPELLDIAADHDLAAPEARGAANDAIEVVDKALRAKRQHIFGLLKQDDAVIAQAPTGPRVQPPDLRALTEEYEIAKAAVSNAQNWITAKADAERQIEAAKARLATLEKAAADSARALAAVYTAAEVESGEALAKRAEAAREKLAGANETAQKAAAWARADEAKAKRDKREVDHAKLQKAVERLAQMRIDLLAGADLPAGLALSEDGALSYKGVPYPDQASSEEQITTALAVAVATRPKLRLLRVRDGNRLDSKHKRALAEWLKENDVLALVEIVDESGRVGIVIEDGEVVADNRSTK